MAKILANIRLPADQRSSDPGPNYAAPGFKMTTHIGVTERLAYPHEGIGRKVDIPPGMEAMRVKRVVSQRNEDRLRSAEKSRAHDLGITKAINASGHVVKLPEGPYMYHRDRQKTALEVAKSLPRGQRGFALQLAKDHGAEKRALQPRVPAGSPTGGRWTK